LPSGQNTQRFFSFDFQKYINNFTDWPQNIKIFLQFLKVQIFSL
jgi:hypothetical protein